MNNNPALADWFFCHRVQRFVEVFYLGVQKSTDYWMRFEWQHRGSPHVHGVAWLPKAPDVKQLLESTDNIKSVKEVINQYTNKVVTTINPAVAPDGIDVDDAPPPVTQPHICNKSYLDIEDRHEDLSHAKDTDAALKHTVSELVMVNRHVDLATPRHCSQRQP